MPGSIGRPAWGALTAIAVAGIAISGCSSAEKLIGLNTTAPATTASSAPQQVTADNCPPTDVRPGTSTLTLTAAPTANSQVLGVRYQGTLGRLARECHVVGNAMTIKVGIQGRIILGPAGMPGEVSVPLRIAVIQEGPEPKTVWTKFYQIPVQVPDGQTSVAFTHIEPFVNFPLPSRAEIDNYIVYVGFDPGSMKVETRKPARKKR